MPEGGILRLPYSVTISNEGALSVTSTSDGELSLTQSNGGALRLEIYNPKTNDTLYAGGGNVATITAYEGDYGYDLMFTVLDADGVAFNLTGATVKFKMALPSATTLKVDGTCTLIEATEGTCKWTTTSTNFDTPGVYEAELFITFTSPAKQYTISGITVAVEQGLPRGT